jgi:hypothetical protein
MRFAATRRRSLRSGTTLRHSIAVPLRFQPCREVPHPRLGCCGRAALRQGEKKRDGARMDNDDPCSIRQDDASFGERALYDGRDQAKPGAIEGRPRGRTRCWRSRRHPSNNLQLLVVKTSHRGHPMERLKADRPRSLALAASTTGYRSGGAVQRCSGSRGVVGSPFGVRGKTSKGNCSEYFYSFLWSAGTGLVLYLAAAGKGLRDGCRSSRRRRVFVSWGPGLASEKPAPG